MNRHLGLFCLLVVPFISACLDDSSGRAGTLPPLSLEGQVISCEQDLDCAVVELTCCTDCQGDETVVVNKDYEDDIEERNKQSCASDIACEHMWCGYKLPRCVEGTCTYDVVDEWDVCEIDDDCTIVELGCCDYCNGGRAVAANKGFEDFVKNTLGEECEEETMCTLMACALLLTRCTDGNCESYADPSWGTPPEK